MMLNLKYGTRNKQKHTEFHKMTIVLGEREETSKEMKRKVNIFWVKYQSNNIRHKNLCHWFLVIQNRLNTRTFVKFSFKYLFITRYDLSLPSHYTDSKYFLFRKRCYYLTARQKQRKSMQEEGRIWMITFKRKSLTHAKHWKSEFFDQKKTNCIHISLYFLKKAQFVTQS